MVNWYSNKVCQIFQKVGKYWGFWGYSLTKMLRAQWLPKPFMVGMGGNETSTIRNQVNSRP